MNPFPRYLAPLIVSLALASAAASEFPDKFYYYDEDRPKELRAMEGQPAPALEVVDWIGDAQVLEELKGQVVVVDFWATWCGPCRAALPKNVKMVEKFGSKGFTMIGVHDSKSGVSKMPMMAAEEDLNYPLSVDNEGKSVAAWNVRFWPTYFIIDRKGIIRAAGVSPAYVEPIVQKLINEDVEEEAEPNS